MNVQERENNTSKQIDYNTSKQIDLDQNIILVSVTKISVYF